MRIHSVFHVSLLKRYHRDGHWVAPPPPVIIDDEAEWEVDRIWSTDLSSKVTRTR